MTMSFGKPGGDVCDDVEAEEVRGRTICAFSLQALDICVGLGGVGASGITGGMTSPEAVFLLCWTDRASPNL